MRYIIGLFVIIIGLSSCTIKQHYSFNDDFSGTHELTVDMSLMANMMGDTDTLDDALAGATNQDSVVDEMNGISGISNAFINMENLAIGIGFDFNNVESLNSAMNEYSFMDVLTNVVTETKSEKNDDIVQDMFELKGKKMKFSLGELDLSDSDEMKGMEEMKGMTAMLKYELSMSFARPIKKVDNKACEISSDGKTVTYKTNLEEISNGTVNTDIVVKFR